MENVRHIPVMVREVEELLDLKAGAIYVDGTLGLGGHASVMARRLGQAGRIIGIDQDEDAIAIARETLKDFAGQLDIVKSNFKDLVSVLDGLGVGDVDGILLDLGVSSLQFDEASRGFSFRMEGPLDMRMDRQASFSAKDLVNSFSEEDIAQVIWRFGEERFSRRIAHAIVLARSVGTITTTTELSNIILKAMPYRVSCDGLHPATRTFQALRIAVNHELDVLTDVLGAAFGRLNAGGRLCVISFHSLEDRIVKDHFRQQAEQGVGKILTKKPLRPGDEEATTNPRARSARVRAIERIA